jgi:hypothetical protein
MMGGDVTVMSEPGKGSVFTVRLPGGARRHNYHASYEDLGVHVTACLLCIRQHCTGDPDCPASSSRSMQKSKEDM